MTKAASNPTKKSPVKTARSAPASASSKTRKPRKDSNGAAKVDGKPRPMKNKRAVENKNIRREALREELKAREYLRQLELIDKEFGEINDHLKNLKGPTARDTKNSGFLKANNFIREISRSEARVKVLKERAVLNFRRLNKVLPDLKAVEISDPEGKNPFANLIEAMRESIQDDDK